MTLVQQHSVTGSQATSKTETFSAATAGNLLLCCATLNENGGVSNFGTTPTGWTQLSTFRIGTTHLNISIYGKIAAGGETSVQVTQSGAVNRIQTWFGEFSGSYTLTLDGSNTAGTTAGVQIGDSGALTPSVSNCLMFALVSEKNAQNLTEGGGNSFNVATVSNEVPGTLSAQKITMGCYYIEAATITSYRERPTWPTTNASTAGTIIAVALAGGSTTPQTLSASSSTAAVVVDLVQKPLSSAASAVASAVDVASKILPSSVSLTISLMRRTSKIISVSQTVSPLMASLLTRVLALSALSSLNVSLLKLAKSILSASQGSVATSIKRPSHVISAALSSVATLSGIRAVLQTLSATASSVATLTRRTGKIISLSLSTSASRLSSILKSFSTISQGSLVTNIKRSNHSIPVALGSTAAFAGIKVVLQTISASATTIATLARRVSMISSVSLSSSVSRTSLILKSFSITSVTSAVLGAIKIGGTVFPQTLSAAASSSVSMTKLAGKSIIISASTITSSVRSVSFHSLVTVPTSASFIRRCTKILTTSATLSVSLNKSGRKTISASCTTVASFASGLVKKVTLAATAVGVATIALLKITIQPVKRGAHAVLLEVRLRVSMLGDLRLRRSKVQDVRMRDSDLADVRLRRSKVKDVHAAESDLTE